MPATKSTKSKRKETQKNLSSHENKMTRHAEFAGTWYPDTADECETVFKQWEQSFSQDNITHSLIGGIVPHAGWFYSGKIAYEVFFQLQKSRPSVSLFILFGGHLGKSDSKRIMIEGSYETPFGELSTETTLAKNLVKNSSFFIETENNFYRDNATELQFPMIKYLWPKTKIIVIGMPPTFETLSLSQMIHEVLIQHNDTLFIGSTDMTHYGPNYQFTPMGKGFSGLNWTKDVNDAQLLGLIEKSDTSSMIAMANDNHNACCIGSVVTAMECAKLSQLITPKILSYTTSYDIAPDNKEPLNFVGYAGVVF